MAEAKSKVLVVDDVEGIREHLADLLAAEGYQALTAVDGADGLEQFVKHQPDMVITDVLMPAMDGVEMVQRIREKQPLTPVIFMSGFFGSADLDPELLMAIEAFGDPVLSKPFTMSEVSLLVSRALS